MNVSSCKILVFWEKSAHYFECKLLLSFDDASSNVVNPCNINYKWLKMSPLPKTLINNKPEPITRKGLKTHADSNVKYRFDNKWCKCNNETFALAVNRCISCDDSAKILMHKCI